VTAWCIAVPLLAVFVLIVAYAIAAVPE